MRLTRQPWDVTEQMFLSLAEVERLLRFVRAGDALDPAAAADRLIIEVLLFSGLRCSEFCRVRLRDTVAGTGESAIAVRGAPGAGRRVWLPRCVSDLIAEHARGRVGRGAAAHALDQPLVVNERGRAFERTGLYRRVVRILSAAGLGERASVQLLRHTYGYLAYLRTGGNLLFVQQQLGHAHPMITSVYARFVPMSGVDLADRVADSENPRRPAHGRRRRRRVVARSDT